MTTATPTDRLLDRPEAADYLGVKTTTLENWAATRRYPLPFVKVGRRVKYRVSDLEAFIESRTVRPVDIDN